MIEIKNIHKYFSTNHVLRGLSFSVPVGSVTALIGPNGSGKSTTIRALTGYIDVDHGSVEYDGKKMSSQSTSLKRNFGYAPESAPSYREMTVNEYLTFISKIRGVNKRKRINHIARAIDSFSLSPVESQAIGTLSKGFRHRVSLAQCMLGNPPCIILDEPTDGLDPIQKIETRKIITELSKTKAVLLTTHILEEVEMLCDRVVSIQHGQVVYDGSVNEIADLKDKTEKICLRVSLDDKSSIVNLLNNTKNVIAFKSEDDDSYSLFTLQISRKTNDEFAGLKLLSDVIFRKGLKIVELKKEPNSLQRSFEFWSKGV